MSLFSDLRKILRTYLTKDQIETIHQAFLAANEAHEGQKRRTGEPYITHPVAVAKILAGMHMDHESIMAALLHDVIEDTGVDKDTLTKQFGKQVAELVDGVSKLTQIKFETRAEAQAENFRKMMLAMVKDLRVILVKLADRLHNMRTLDSLPAGKRRRIATETLEIYAPIANRLGMHEFRIEYEELGFAAVYPNRYRALKDAVKRAVGNRKQIIKEIEKSLKACLKTHKIPHFSIAGREKHLYSIYKKMRNKHIPFSEIMDVYGFRIIVDSIDNCYRVLGAAHNLYKPLPERFKDYIAIPKTNGYQSLHTTLFGPFGVPIEIQIRTQEMEKMANSGIAAHWLYKSHEAAGNEAQQRAQEWLRNVIEMQQSASSSLDFIENVKIDLFPDEVYVFTPKGNIVKLQSGATPVDFAYAVHTDIGNTCVATKIDRHLAPLSTRLSNGQTVEIISAPAARPNPAWLNFVVTAKARSNIRHWLKTQRRGESIKLGKQLLEKTLSELDKTIEDFSDKKIEDVAKQSSFTTSDELYENIGLGHQFAPIVARRLTEAPIEEEPAAKTSQPLLIRGSEGMLISFAECCHPIPGDPVVGILEKGRGIIVHMEDCHQIEKLCNRPDQCMEIRWEENIDRDFRVEIRVEVLNRRGMLAMIANAIADANGNIEDIHVSEPDEQYRIVTILLCVKSRDHLASIIRRIRRIDEITKITRIMNETPNSY